MFMRSCIIGCLWLISSVANAAEPPSVFVFNQTQGNIVVNSQDRTVRPIASITKLMTAMVVLDSHAELGAALPLDRKVRGSLPPGQYTRGDLLAAMLVKSDNSAAETLAENYPGGREAFISAMNIKSRIMGLENTHFKDPSGLSAANISTAQEVAQIVSMAIGYRAIHDISTQQRVRVELASKHRSVAVANTNNRFLSIFPHNVLISKTGYTVPAGYCMSLLVENHGQQFVIVVLGERTKFTRLAEVKRIMHQHVL